MKERATIYHFLSQIAERNTGWFYDIEHKRLYVKTAGDNRQKIEIVVQ